LLFLLVSLLSCSNVNRGCVQVSVGINLHFFATATPASERKDGIA